MATAMFAGTGAITAAPTCNAIYPATGIATDTVAVTGTNFTPATTVTINGAAASSVVVKSRNALTCVVPTGTGTGNVVVATANGSGTLTNGWTYSSGGSSVSYFVDWRTATGTGTSAIRDTAKFSGESGGGSWLNVVTVATAGGTWPGGMSNCLQVNLPGSTLSHMLTKVTADASWATPGIGSSVYYRIYHKNDFPDAIDSQSYHPLQNGLSNLAWEWKNGDVTSGLFNLDWYSSPLTANYPYTHFDLLSALSTGVVYRIEWQLSRTGASAVLPVLRVYNSSDALIYSSSSGFVIQDSASSMTSAGTNANLFNVGNIDDCYQCINLGNNGPNLGSRTGNNYQYWGGFAVSTTDWCGAYSSSTG